MSGEAANPYKKIRFLSPTDKKPPSDFLKKMRDEDIDLSEIPEIATEQMARAVMRVGGKPPPKGKVRINLLLDAGVVAYFKSGF